MKFIEKESQYSENNLRPLDNILKKELKNNITEILQKSDYILEKIKGDIIFQDIIDHLGDPEFFPKYEDVFNNNEYDKAIIEYRKGLINKEQYNKILNDHNKIKRKIIKCKNIEEFKKVVNILPIPDIRKKYYVEHELQHGSKAEEYNLVHNYGLEFTKVAKGENGWFKITPFTSVNYPTDITFEEYSKMYKSIINEVDELSYGDKKQINDIGG